MVDWQKQQQLVLEAMKHWNGPHAPKRIVMRGIRERHRLADCDGASRHLRRAHRLAKTVEANPQLKLIVQQGVRPPYFVFNAKSRRSTTGVCARP